MSADDELNLSSTPTKTEHIANESNGQLSRQCNNLSPLESPPDAKIRRRRNIHNNTIDDEQTTSTLNNVPSTKPKRNVEHTNKSSPRKAKHCKRKSSRGSSSDDDENNGHTFSIFSTIMSHKQHLTYGAIAIGLAVSLYPFLKYQFGFGDQSRKAVGSSATQPPRRSDAVKSALKDAPPDLDHQHINDMMGPHMQHRGQPAMRSDKGAGKGDNGRSSKRGGSFGLGSLLGGGMGSLYSAGAIMFALYSFGKVFMRRGKLNEKKCKNHKQRGRKRPFKEDDEEELSGSGDGSDANQKEKEDKSENASTSVSTSTTEDEDADEEKKSALPPGKSQSLLPDDSVAKSNTDELRRLLAETQKRLEILEQQETQKLRK